MSTNNFAQLGTESKPLSLTANDLHAVGVPLTLSHPSLFEYQHRDPEEHGAACKAWIGRKFTLRTGHIVELGLMCQQANECERFVERASPLNMEYEFFEVFAYHAARIAAEARIDALRHQVRFAEIALENTRRDTYHYAESLESREFELEESMTFLGDLLYSEAAKAAPEAVKRAA